jgi:hypothetical protein
MSIFVEKLSNFISFSGFLRIHFGSGAARIRMRNEFFQIRIRFLFKVSDPTGSGSITLF